MQEYSIIDQDMDQTFQSFINEEKISLGSEKEITLKNNIKDSKNSNCERCNNIGSCILILISNIMYYISLGGCNDTQEKCLSKQNLDYFYILFFLVFLSSFFYSFIIILIIEKNISWIHLLYMIPIQLGLFFYDTGSDLYKHGIYNITGFSILFIGSFLFLYSVVLYLNYVDDKSFVHKMFVLNIILVIIITLRYFYFSKISNSCNNWDLGLNNTRIDNNPDKYSCYFNKPDICYLDIYDNILDFSRIMKLNCSDQEKSNHMKEAREQLIKYINKTEFKDTYNFGFPITTSDKFKITNKITPKDFSKLVLDNMIDMDKTNLKPESAEYPEVTLKFHPNDSIIKQFLEKQKTGKINYYGEVNINIPYKKELIQKRKELEFPSLFKNVLIIYIDALSRQHFIRKMPKTKAFLEKFMKNTHSLNFRAYQFLKYHTFQSWTQLNLMPMFYGKKMKNYEGTNLIYYYKEMGFITAQGVDMCSKEVWEPNRENSNINFIQWDHENVALFCDPSYINRDEMYLVYRGAYSLLKRCFYGKEIHDYQFEYGEKFWKTYINEKKFLRLSFNDAHESTFEVIKYLDEPLFNFLNGFYNKGYLNDTILFLLSDHGNHMPGIYNLLFAEDYEMERVMGTLFIVINDNSVFLKKNKAKYSYYLDNIFENQQTYITPYDIHDTLIHILYKGKNNYLYSEKGESLFNKIDSYNRKCSNYDDCIDEDICRCIPYNNTD